jgi:hypothetical protein
MTPVPADSNEGLLTTSQHGEWYNGGHACKREIKWQEGKPERGQGPGLHFYNNPSLELTPSH